MSARAVLVDLKNAFPRAEVTSGTVKLYERLLADVPAAELAAAADDLIRMRDEFPSVHKLREAVVERRLGLPSEQEALAQVDARIRWGRGLRDGLAPGEPGPEAHPLVLEAADAVGGLYALRTAEQPSIVRAQFLRAYRDLRAERILAAVRSTLL